MGNDKLYGGSDNDLLEGGLGDDVLGGNSGQDTFCYTLNEGKDTIDDFEVRGTLKDTLLLIGFNNIEADEADEADKEPIRIEPILITDYENHVPNVYKVFRKDNNKEIIIIKIIPETIVGEYTKKQATEETEENIKSIKKSIKYGKECELSDYEFLLFKLFDSSSNSNSEYTEIDENKDYEFKVSLNEKDKDASYKLQFDLSKIATDGEYNFQLTADYPIFKDGKLEHTFDAEVNPFSAKEIDVQLGKIISLPLPFETKVTVHFAHSNDKNNKLFNKTIKLKFTKKTVDQNSAVSVKNHSDYLKNENNELIAEFKQDDMVHIDVSADNSFKGFEYSVIKQPQRGTVSCINGPDDCLTGNRFIEKNNTNQKIIYNISKIR